MTESVEVSGDAMNENDTPLLIVRLDSDSDSGTRISSNSSSSSSSSEKLKLASIPNTHVTLCSIGNGDGGSASINTKGTRPIANGNGNGVDESLEKEDSHDHEPNLEIETNFEAPVLNTTDAEQKQISVCEDNDVVLNQPENPEINLGTPNLDSSQPNVTPLEAVKPTLEKTISEINEAPELAFIEKKPIIPGFDNDDDDNNSCVSHETDFWKIVSGKTEEELSKEAEEEKEWLRCIEEEDRKIAEEGRLKNLLKEVAKNEAESGDDDCESDEELTPPVVTDPCLIFDPSKVPDTGVIQPEYREAMGFVDMTDINTIDSSNPAIDTAPDKTAHIQIATNSQKGNSTEAAAVEAEAEEEQIAEISVNESPKPKSIEELEAELVEEAKQAARTEPVMDEGQNVSSKPSLESEEAKTEIPANEFSIMTEPITVHETKVEDSISMIYKIGVRKKLATTGKLPALKAKSQSVKANTADAMDESMDKDAEELERLAMQELLSEAKRGAERAREIGPLGWQKSRIPSTNKRFLINTIRGTLHDPRDRQRRRSRSRSDDRRRSRSRERRRSKSRDRRRTESQSRDQRRSTSRSRERRRTRSRSRDRRRPRSRSRERSSSRGPNRSRRKRARSRSTSPDESGSRNSKKKSLSGGKTSAEHETEPEIPIEVKMTLVKPSKCSWSSDEDDLDLSTAQSDTKVNTVPVLEGEERPEQAEDAIIHISDQSDLSLGSTKLDHVLETSATVGQISPTGSTSSEHCRTFDALKDKNSAVSENVSSSVESAKTEKPSTELMPAASEGNPSLPVKNVEPPGEELVTGILVDQVTDFEMKTTLTKLDAIVEVKAIADLNELEPYSDPEDKLMDTACSGELLTGSEGYPPCNTKENSRNESETESKGANYNPLDELTRRKLDIVESALREIEENPEEPSLFSDHERQHKAKKKKHKEHKKHKHKHKSKHKKKKRRS